jgi:hypothetical protein
MSPGPFFALIARSLPRVVGDAHTDVNPSGMGCLTASVK